MPEQGPTEEERVLITPDGKGKAAKRVALESARARHVREAVEGLRDGWISGAVHRYITGTVYADSADRFRADLLDALGGTTPPLDETGGKA